MSDYQCPRCLAMFETNKAAIDHLYGGACEEVRCERCGHPIGCTTPQFVEALRQAMRSLAEENAALRTMAEDLQKLVDKAG